MCLREEPDADVQAARHATRRLVRRATAARGAVPVAFAAILTCRTLVGAADCSGDRPPAADGKRRSKSALLQPSALPLPMRLVQPAILLRRYPIRTLRSLSDKRQTPSLITIDGSRTIDPILGTAMSMRDSQNPDHLIANDVEM